MQLEAEGWFVVKLIKTNKNGVPDLLASKKDRTVFIEVKQEKGVLSEIQKYRIEEIKSKGIECYIWTSYGIDYDKSIKRDNDKFKL